MQLGIVTPVVSLNPRFDPPQWEVDGGIDDVVVVAQAAERLDYAWLGCPEHVAIPEAAAKRAGRRYYDPVATLSYVAAATTTIGLLPHVTVLGYHHPLALVKTWGTVDVISGGRLILGVGVGSLRQEFELLGARFEGRGDDADDAIAALRAAFGRQVPAYAGTRYRFEGFVVEPSGHDVDVPIWVGGRTRRSLRRAVELGDGWIPFGMGLPELRRVLDHPPLAEARARRGDRFEVVLAPEPPLDPLDDPAGTAETVAAYRDAGATALALRFRHQSRHHYLEQLEAMRRVVDGMAGSTG